MPEIERAEPVGVSFREIVERVDINLASLFLFPEAEYKLDLEYEITPNDFLSFAEKDILQDDVRGLVNGWLHSEPWSRTPSLDQVLQGL